ncbi:protein capicua homolog isoform X1 [Oryzias latipes]|uniref:protein capicua homolog isoform X1 n=1 Tax=Oryzias latipes TaxID=8090 RepID=UPI0005CBE0C9|nr:protein capicua homolog isoform X1 [Oryzias latipes]
MEMEEGGSSGLNSGSAAFRMSALQPLREFINARLAAAAAEIFRQVEKTFIQYEEELCCRRRLLEMSLKPQLQLHNILALPQHHRSADQEQKSQERISRGTLREPEPPGIKEEWEEVFISHHAKQLHLKQETDVLMETPKTEESLSSHQLQSQETTSATNEETELENTDQRNRGDRGHVQDEVSSHVTGSHCGSNSENMLEKAAICGKELKIKTLVEKPHRKPLKRVEAVMCVAAGPPQKQQENVPGTSVHPVTACRPPAPPAPLSSTVSQPVHRSDPKSVGLLQPVGLINGQVIFKSLYLPPSPAAPLLNTSSYRTKRHKDQQFKSQPYIKKPPNAFMLFLKEQRATVPPELKSNSSAVNKLLGEKWSLLSEEQKAKYFNQAEVEKRLHAQQHPDWSSSDNYGKKKKISRKGAPSKSNGLNAL